MVAQGGGYSYKTNNVLYYYIKRINSSTFLIDFYTHFQKGVYVPYSVLYSLF